MSVRLSLSGTAAVRRRLLQAQQRARTAARAATAEVITFLLEKSREILDKEVYDKPRDEFDEAPDKGDADALYNAFQEQLQELSETASEGKLLNVSPHALFLEDGTDEEGTGSHFVPVGEKGYLAWMDGATGEIRFSKGHEVSGIVPIRFLARSLTENRGAVLDLYRAHYQGLFR